jgi:Flp pilus assembly protein TadG
MRTEVKFGRFPDKGGRAGEFGAEVVELAFVLPLLLTLLVGIFWAARGYNVYESITRAAREGARVAVAPSCSACGNAVPSVTNVENAVLNSLTASSIDTTQVTIPTCTGNLSSKICYQRDVQLNTSTPKEFGIVVGLTYPFQFTLPFTSVGVSTINITTTVQMREEN